MEQLMQMAYKRRMVIFLTSIPFLTTFWLWIVMDKITMLYKIGFLSSPLSLFIFLYTYIFMNGIHSLCRFVFF